MFLCYSHNALPHTGHQSQIPLIRVVHRNNAYLYNYIVHLPLLQIPFSIRVSEYFLSGLRKFHEIGHKAQNTTFTPEKIIKFSKAGKFLYQEGLVMHSKEYYCR